jgi:hypothetical protein
VYAFLIRPVVWWAGEAEQQDPLRQTAWERGKADAIAAAKDGRRFGFVATVVTCAMPAAVGFATTHLPLGWQLLLIVLAAAVGYVLVPTAWAVAAAALAPVRQRNEARGHPQTGAVEGDSAQTPDADGSMKFEYEGRSGLRLRFEFRRRSDE